MSDDEIELTRDLSDEALGVRVSEIDEEKHSHDTHSHDDDHSHDAPNGKSTHNVLGTDEFESGEHKVVGGKPKSKSFYIADIFTSRSSFFIHNKDTDGYNDLMEAGDSEPIIPPLAVRGLMGLWGHYAISGLLFGMSGALGNLCRYQFEGEPNLCANSYNIVYFPWAFKIVLAFLTYGYQPMGSRYKVWMMMGWSVAIALLILLTAISDQFYATAWLIVLLLIQLFVCLSDVQADGYLSQLSDNQPRVRAIIQSTGFFIRFGFSILAGVIQATILNSSNRVSPHDCPEGWRDCWKQGINVNGYYGVILALAVIFLSQLPFLEEFETPAHPRYTLNVYWKNLWSTMSSYPSFIALLAFMGLNTLTNFRSTVNFYIQYDVLELTNFQSGISTIGIFLAIPIATYTFNVYLSGLDWRVIQFASVAAWSCIGLIWIIVYNNDSDLLYPWFTVFIDVVQSFVYGISQGLFYFYLIELPKAGIDASIFEHLTTSIAYASRTVNGMIATQITAPLNVAPCNYANPAECAAHTVWINGKTAFALTGGPHAYTVYCLITVFCSIGCAFIFVPMMYKNAQSYRDAKKLLDQEAVPAADTYRGYAMSFLFLLSIAYCIGTIVFLMDTKLQCYKFIGGEGC